MITDPVAAVLFDMDGTLVDSDAAVARSWRTWAWRWGVDPARALAINSGHPAEATVRRLRPDLDEALLATAARDQLERQYGDLADVVATPGATDLIEAITLAGLPWAVVTSADARLAAARLRAAGITAPLVVDREMVAAGKPAPDGYLLAARRLGVDAGACLVVEDSEPGVASGRAAGARVAGLRGVPSDLPLASLADLHQHVLAPVTA